MSRLCLKRSHAEEERKEDREAQQHASYKQSNEMPTVAGAATATATSMSAAQVPCTRIQLTVSPQQRDDMVAALLTISTALGLASETLHICVDLLDRFLALEKIQSSRLEILGVACLWIAVKFYETPLTIETRAIKSILKKRRHSGNWTWQEILEMEMKILQRLRFRIMAPTILDLVQRRIAAVDKHDQLSRENVHLAMYFADLLLLRHAANCYTKELLVDAIWFVLLQSPKVPSVESPLLGPVLLMFLAHKDNIDANSDVYKSWFALRCKHGRSLVWPWQVPVDWNCSCRICQNVRNGEFDAALESHMLVSSSKSSSNSSNKNSCESGHEHPLKRRRR